MGRCASCGHIVRTLDDASANHRSAAYGGDPALDAARLQVTWRFLRRLVGTPTSVFEIGYGSGRLLEKFLDAGAQVAGADPDQLDIDVVPSVRRKGRLWHGRIEDVEVAVAGDSHELVLGVHVLEHVDDPASTLHRALALLAPGGVACFVTPAADSLGLRWYRRNWWMLEDPTHVRFFSARSLAELARNAGFTDVRVERLLADSLMLDAASLARRWLPHRPDGVLASGVVRRVALASMPVVLVLRALIPRSRPSLALIARRPA